MVMRRHSLGVTATLSFLGCLAAFPAWAALNLNSAVWDGRQLVVDGTGDRGDTVTVVNAYATGQVLGTSRIGGNERWSVRANRPDPVPCAVTASALGEADQTLDVANAPGDCLPKPPGGNNPPVCVIETPRGDITIPRGGTVNYTATVTDPDGDPVTISWAFAGGNPASSTLEDPGVVRYPQVGTFLTTLNATDDQGAACVEQARTITVVNQPQLPDVSINSTSRSCGDQADPKDLNAPDCNNTPVPEQPFVGNADGYTVLAINDLGMHCGDLDTRISSILPPFQVLLAQVIQRGPEPQQLGPTQAQVFYSAVRNQEFPDPALALGGQVCGTDADGNPIPCTGVYKTNFWDYPVPLGSYDAFYPALSPFDPTVQLTPLTDIFGITYDISLPVPNVENLYLGPNGLYKDGDELLTAALQDMPGIAAPYASANPLSNEPQLVEEHLGDKPFFGDFPFGYIANGVNWFEGAGIPFAAYDDFGRENAYPLVRVQATTDGQPPNDTATNVVATVDTVLPISGEASCKNCHADPMDPNFGGSRTTQPTDALEAQPNPLPVVDSTEDPLFGSVPLPISVEWATDINVLRLHDKTHGPDYVSYCNTAPCPPDPCEITAANPNGTDSCLTNQALVQNKPVVCQVCHYTPALDLAQLGPLAGAPYDPVTETGDPLANGRNQVAHQSNSRVMHNHHGQFTDLFPAIDAPVQAGDGSISNQATRLTQLEESCYQCHPGTQVQCLRGAMFDGAMLCNDCHGDMSQVGADFSTGVSPENPGDFQLGLGNFYEPGSAQPRVPWANEPGCGSCHTGDADSNATNDGAANPADLIVNVADNNGYTDGIRLRQAFRTGDPKATPIVPLNIRFAENPIPASFNGFVNPGAGTISTGAANPKLYRVSTGHGGVMCEGCHGATHAEFDSDTPALRNDDVTSIQLQGHAGTISECSTCHGAGWEPDRQDGLGGPHGMHVVGDTNFARGGHEDVGPRNECFACHGGNNRGNSPGTVLSRAAVTRTLETDNDLGIRTFEAGEPIGCADCHDGND
jgi:hypothetical protein